jgi:hypothetical protein
VFHHFNLVGWCCHIITYHVHAHTPRAPTHHACAHTHTHTHTHTTPEMRLASILRRPLCQDNPHFDCTSFISGRMHNLATAREAAPPSSINTHSTHSTHIQHATYILNMLHTFNTLPTHSQHGTHILHPFNTAQHATCYTHSTRYVYSTHIQHATHSTRYTFNMLHSGIGRLQLILSRKNLKKNTLSIFCNSLDNSTSSEAFELLEGF